VIFRGVEGRALVIALNVEGVAVSQSSACTSGQSKASHVLKMMGLKGEELLGGVRFSVGVFNRMEEVEYVLSVLPDRDQGGQRIRRYF